MAIVRIDLPAGYKPGAVSSRETENDKHIRVTGPKSMSVLWSSELPPVQQAHTVSIDLKFEQRPLAVAGAVGVYLPPTYLQATAVKRATNLSKLVQVHGPANMQVQWTIYKPIIVPPVDPPPPPDPEDPASPNGTRGKTYTDHQGNVVDIDLGTNSLLKNGQPYIVGDAAGWAMLALWWNDVNYHKGTGSRHWYSPDLVNATWTDNGMNDPQTGATPLPRSANGTTGAGVVFPESVSWTLGVATANGFETLREGIRAQTGQAVEYKVHADLLYIKNNLGQWWRWSEPNAWVWFGVVAPDYVPPSPPPPQGALRYILTTGSINANSAVLRDVPTAAYNLFKVGDWIVGCLGKEPGQGMRGTVGVGGSIPGLGFDTYAAMVAAAGNFATGIRVYVRDGQNTVYLRDPTATNGWFRHFDLYDGWHYGVVQPRALDAQILEKSGGDILLSRSASVSVVGMDVVLNVIPIMNSMIGNEPDNGLLIPGQYFVSGGTFIDRPNFTLEGQKATTRFESLGGAPQGWFRTRTGRANVTVKHFTLVGNWLLNGIGFNIPGATEQWSPGYNNPYVANYSGGVLFDPGCSNALMQDVATINVAGEAFSAWFCDNARALDNTFTKTTKDMDYVPMSCIFLDCTGGGAERNKFTSTYLGRAFENFKSIGQTFNDNEAINGLCASNASGAVWNRNLQRFTAGCAEADAFNTGVQEAMDNVIHIQGGYPSAAVQILDHTIIVDGPTHPNGVNINGVVIEHGKLGAVVARLRYQAQGGGIMCHSEAVHAVIRDSVAACGDLVPTMGDYFATIYMYGSLSNECPNNSAPSQRYYGVGT